MALEQKFKVAIYCRVSTGDQTLDQQREPLITLAENNNWAYSVFEEVISGAKQSRPKLDEMMTRVRGSEFGGVLINKLDRLGRSLKHLIQLIEEFNNKKIKFICLNPAVDTTTASGRFFIQIIGAVAELEREMIRERTKAKLDYLRTKGFTLGRPKGAKDKKVRRRAGYLVRWLKNKQTSVNLSEQLKEEING